MLKPAADRPGGAGQGQIPYGPDTPEDGVQDEDLDRGGALAHVLPAWLSRPDRPVFLTRMAMDAAP